MRPIKKIDRAKENRQRKNDKSQERKVTNKKDNINKA
jgi:hypothetical protein